MKFYVYANKSNVKDASLKERAIYFVPEEDMSIWASKFDPAIMEFCGVSIVADTREEAKEAFLNPAESDGFDKMISEQEPLLTRVTTRKFENAKNDLANATMDLMVNRLARLWRQIDDMLRAMAQLYVLHHNDMTEEEAYQKIKSEWLDKYRER